MSDGTIGAGLPRVNFPTLGFEVADWIEAFLCHGPGDVQGQPLELDDEFVLFLAWAYRLDPQTGRRLTRRAVFSRPKGRAKSELAGALVCAEALGPVRFAGWNADGDPVGAPVRSPFIRCLATEEGQAGNTYDNVRVMLTEGAAADEFPIDVGLTRVFLKGPDGGEITPSTASSSAKDGGKETFAVADETHLYVVPELKRMHATVRRNLAKRKIAEPWMLDTTTSFLPGQGSIAEGSFEQYGRGEVDAALLEHGVLYDHREAPALTARQFASDKRLREALRYVYGPAAAWMDLDRLVAEVRDPETDEADSRRYFLNQRVALANAYMPLDLWRPCRDLERRVEDGERIALGFDGSRLHDATALVGCTLEDGHLFLLALWEKPEGVAGQGWEVPTSEVDAAVDRAFARFKVARGYFDPPYWESEVDAWHAEYGDAIVKFATAKDSRMAPALRRLQTDVRARKVTHDGDEDLERHVVNARTRKTRAGDVIQKDRPGSPHKIDAAVAATLAYEARADAIAAGALTKGKPSRVVFT